MENQFAASDVTAELGPDGELVVESGGTSRRTFLKAAGGTLASFSLMGILAACGSDSGAGGGGGSATLTLRMPLPEDIGVPDPDIMYGSLGVVVMESAYEGLVRYKTGTREIIPALAKSWEISPDGRTYTFDLQGGVKFHDGTPVDAEAWKQSFTRRLEIGEGPAYMLEDVKSMATPDASTFVVTLNSPNNAFIHYMACPFQPYATSPTAIKQHESNGDLAQDWLKTHDAGSGAYEIKEFVSSSHYLLERFEGYWDAKPHFKSIRIQIVPSIATQKLQLDQNAFDLVTVGLPIPDVKSYEENDGYAVTNTEGGLAVAAFMNGGAGVFADKALRQATLDAIDRGTVVQNAWGGLVEPMEGLWPPLVLDPKLAPLPTKLDPEAAKALIAEAPSKTLDLAWYEAGGAPYEQTAGSLQLQLSELGFDVTVRAMPDAQIFDLINQPAAKRPDMLVVVFGGDALHLDTTLRILFRTEGGVNFYEYANPALDALMDEAVEKPKEAEADPLYRQCSKIIIDDALLIPLCVQPASIVAHDYITGVEPNSMIPQNFWPPTINA